MGRLDTSSMRTPGQAVSSALRRVGRTVRSPAAPHPRLLAAGSLDRPSTSTAYRLSAVSAACVALTAAALCEDAAPVKVAESDTTQDSAPPAETTKVPARRKYTQKKQIEEEEKEKEQEDEEEQEQEEEDDEKEEVEDEEEDEEEEEEEEVKPKPK